MSTGTGWGDTCAEVVVLADDLVDGQLSPARAAEVAQHLTHCPGCTTYVDQLRAVLALLRGLGERG